MFQVLSDKQRFEIEPGENPGEGTINGKPYRLDMMEVKPGMWHIIKDRKSYTIILEECGDDKQTVCLRVNGKKAQLSVKNKLEILLEQMGLNAHSGKKVNELKAPMPGLVLRTLIKEGDKVQKGDTLLVLEAMKMENTIKSAGEGEVTKILVKDGQAVEKGQVLITFR